MALEGNVEVDELPLEWTMGACILPMIMGKTWLEKEKYMDRKIWENEIWFLIWYEFMFSTFLYFFDKL